MGHRWQIDSMLWEIVWDALNLTFDQDDLLDTGSHQPLYDLDVSTADRGDLVNITQAAIEDET